MFKLHINKENRGEDLFEVSLFALTKKIYLSQTGKKQCTRLETATDGRIRNCPAKAHRELLRDCLPSRPVPPRYFHSHPG
jgi:hypothetical protein